MGNKKLSLSGTGKEILDQLCDQIDIDRPLGINLAIAKGISKANGPVSNDFKDNKPKWTIPENVIKGNQFLLYKHLIIQELSKPLDDDEIQEYLLLFIESGLRIIKAEIDDQTSMEDYQLTILN